MGRNPAICVLPTLGMLFSLVALTSCGGSSSLGSEGKTESLAQVSLHPQGPTVAKGSSFQLTATAVYNDGKTQDITDSVTWRTSNAAVVKVDQGGDLSAMGVGSAQVSAQYQGIIGADSVTVSPAALVSIAITPNSSSLPVGVSEQLTATGTFTDQSTQDLSQSATWSSSGSSVVAVNLTGMATAKAIGNATVSAAVGTTSGSASVTVSPAALVSIAVTPNSSSLPVGVSEQLTATGTFTDQSTRDLTRSASWNSSAPSVAAVNANGMATAEALGNANLSATVGNTSGSALMSVDPAALVSISVAPNPSSLPVGVSEQLTATGAFTDHSTRDLTQSATWSSSGPSVAAVNATGMATAKALGSATVSAAVGNTAGSASLTVSPAALVSIDVTPNSSSLPVGESEQLSATGTFTDQSTRDVTQSASWSSSGPSVASVTEVGLTTAKTIGSTTVSAAVGNTAGSAQVAVTAAVPVALNISPSTISITLGSSRQLKAMATYSDGSTQDATAVVQWTSSAEDIVSVDSQGLSVAQEVGDATIWVTEQNLTATAQATVIPLALTHYFDLATAQASNLDPTVFLANPGLVPSSICSMIYVFDQKEEMNECCGCKISDSGLLTLSLEKDLTRNTLTGLKPKTGSIKVVSSDLTSNPQCDPISLTPSGLILAWGTNVRDRGDGTSQFVETEFARVPLATIESTALANSCSAVQKLGGGHGVCSCGRGN